MAESVADLGKVHTPDDILVKDEILFLKANSTSNTGELCVAACQNLSGLGVERKAIHIFRCSEFQQVLLGQIDREMQRMVNILTN